MHRLVLLMVVNLAALVVPFGAGCRSSLETGEQLHPPRTGSVAYDVAAAAAEAGTILAINGRALFLILLFGILGGGGYGLLLLGVNGYALGGTLAALYSEAPAALGFVLSYAPLEFSALVAANCGGQMIGWA